MRHAAIREVLRLGPRSPRDRLVLVAVLLHVGSSGEPATAEVATYAELAGVALNTARRSLLKLAADGYLERLERPGRTAAYTPTNLVGPPIWEPSQNGSPPNLGAPDPSQSGSPPNLGPLPPMVGGEDREIRPDGRKRGNKAGHLDGTQHQRPRRAPARPRARAREEAIPWDEPRRPRTPPNAELWQALVDACGLDAAEVKGREAAKVGKAAKGIAEKGGTPADVRARAAAYRQRYPKADLTPLGLDSNWAAVAPTRANGNTHPAAELRAKLAALDQETA